MRNRLMFLANIILFIGLIISWTTPQKAQEKEREKMQATTSVMLRVRRVTIEDAYVAVPATEKIIKKQDDGTFKIDPKLFIAEATNISKDKRTEWKVESVVIEAHPTQGPLPKDRKVFDAIVDMEK